MARLRRASDYPYFDNAGFPIAYAHRGGALTGANVGLENTMVAFQTAVDMGYRYIETDVHATRDGALLAFHDATLDRATDGTGAIARQTISELRSVKMDGREPIPSLNEILSTWAHLRVNIDAKSDSCVGPLVAAIEGHRAWDRVCVASFSPVRTRLLRTLLDPRVPTACAAIEVAALRLLPGRAVRRSLLGGHAQAAQVPVRRGHLEIVTADFVSRAHELGKHVHVWTVDAPDEISRLLELGVDAIMTDRIDVLRDVYRERGIWRERS
ncbi:MAG: glycerophosphodiester phosphodiesterase family protein [Nocardioidaceae bacterium]